MLEAHPVTVFGYRYQRKMFGIVLDVIIRVKAGHFFALKRDVRVTLFKFKQQVGIENSKDGWNTSKGKYL